VAVVLTPFVGRLRGVDMRWLVTGAFVAFAASYFMRSHYTADASLWALALPLLLQGVAMSIFFVPLNTILLDGLPASCVPSASGISNFARITAGSFAASLITTYWDRREALHQARLVEAATPFSPSYQQASNALQSQGLSPVRAAGSLMHQIGDQAYLLSSIELFWVCGWMSLFVISIVWLTRKPAPSDHVVAAD